MILVQSYSSSSAQELSTSNLVGSRFKQSMSKATPDKLSAAEAAKATAIERHAIAKAKEAELIRLLKNNNINTSHHHRDDGLVT